MGTQPLWGGCWLWKLLFPGEGSQRETSSSFFLSFSLPTFGQCLHITTTVVKVQLKGETGAGLEHFLLFSAATQS